MRREAIIALAILTTSPCWAQKRLSLQEAIDQALGSRASIKAEAERVASAQGIRTQAGLIPNPEFQFQNENLRPGQTYARDVDTLALINQPLDILGKRKQRVAVANEGVIRTQAEYDLARWQLVQRVKLAYWAALGSQEVHNVLQRTVENFQKIVDYHAAQLSAGAIAEQDLLRVRLEAERIKISADMAFLAANQRRFELLKEMGETDFPDLALTETLPLASDIAPIGIDEVFAQRKELKVARAAVEQAEANARLQQVSARPDLRPEMLADAQIPVGGGRRMVLVPSDAIQQINGQDVVFVRTAPDRFSVRPVQVGETADGQAPVLQGIQAGDMVAIRGSFILKSQLLKATIESE